ncbi:MAG: TetR/AcrR family transcriptional regulator [Nocardioides sp.]|uniref:TetR/AcrR family transcriptional regulator n=1 Tax=Nocardioides sp. TaxID=35761 RepID=UPI00238697A8|nr:TetR/AcrR family transcriptional regulator [Nocardioides sp.]MDE0776061.1 TetR/AcrR family transcriptional regulator [Nocardioides sp.]
MTPAPPPGAEGGTRPRVEGDREQEILDATLATLAEVGYDRLTMDAVATAARASKATLYRRWSSKPALVIDALKSQKPAHAPVDTGNLREDLLATYCGMGGQADQEQIAILASVITAIARDADFAEAFRRDFIGPKAAVTAGIFARARDRGEIGPDVDLDLITPALPGIVLHRQFLLGEPPDQAFITRVIDQIILPAVAAGQPTAATTTSKDA